MDRHGDNPHSVQPMPVDTPVGAAREPLARVSIAPAALAMDTATDWCRHEVRRFVAWRLIAEAAIVLIGVTSITFWSLDSIAPALLLGLAAGLITALGHVGLAIVAGPLGVNYLKAFTASPPEYLVARELPMVDPRPAERAPDRTEVDLWDLDPTQDLDRPTAAVDGEIGADAGDALTTATVLCELGLTPVATVRTDRNSRIVDLFTDGDRIVAASDRTSGSLTMLTELAGFRVLVSSALLVPPTDGLVVNVVDDAYPARLLLSHQRLVNQAFRSRTRASEPVGLFKLAQQREIEAYRELGLVWGALLDLRCRPRRARLAAAPLADDILLFTGNRLFQHSS